MSKRKNKHRGHYCWVCGRVRANEKFSGRGHRNHICKDCARLSKEQRRQRQKQETDTIFLTEEAALEDVENRKEKGDEESGIIEF